MPEEIAAPPDWETLSSDPEFTGFSKAQKLQVLDAWSTHANEYLKGHPEVTPDQLSAFTTFVADHQIALTHAGDAKAELDKALESDTQGVPTAGDFAGAPAFTGLSGTVFGLVPDGQGGAMNDPQDIIDRRVRGFDPYKGAWGANIKDPEMEAVALSPYQLRQGGVDIGPDNRDDNGFVRSHDAKVTTADGQEYTFPIADKLGIGGRVDFTYAAYQRLGGPQNRGGGEIPGLSVELVPRSGDQPVPQREQAIGAAGAQNISPEQGSIPTNLEGLAKGRLATPASDQEATQSEAQIAQGIGTLDYLNMLQVYGDAAQRAQAEAATPPAQSKPGFGDFRTAQAAQDEAERIAAQAPADRAAAIEEAQKQVNPLVKLRLNDNGVLVVEGPPKPGQENFEDPEVGLSPQDSGVVDSLKERLTAINKKVFDVGAYQPPSGARLAGGELGPGFAGVANATGTLLSTAAGILGLVREMNGADRQPDDPEAVLARGAATLREGASGAEGPAGGIARGIGTTVGLLAGGPSGRIAGTLTMALRGAADAYSTTLTDTKDPAKARVAALETAPMLAAYWLTGGVAAGFASKIVGQEAVPMVKALAGFGGAEVANVGTSAVIRAVEAKPGERLAAAAPTVESLTADTLFAVAHLTGPFSEVSQSARERAEAELHRRGFEDQQLAKPPTQAPSEALVTPPLDPLAAEAPKLKAAGMRETAKAALEAPPAVEPPAAEKPAATPAERAAAGAPATIRLFHGSHEAFAPGDIKSEGITRTSTTDNEVQGAFLTPDESFAKTFGPNIHGYDATLTNTLDLRTDPQREMTFPQFVQFLNDSGLDISEGEIRAVAKNEPGVRAPDVPYDWSGGWAPVVERLSGLIRGKGFDSIADTTEHQETGLPVDQYAVLDTKALKPAGAATPESHIATGAENEIYRQGDRVIKRGYGSTSAPIEKQVAIRKREVELQNAVFGGDNRFEGTHADATGEHPVSSQAFVDGAPPTREEMEAFLESKGFTKGERLHEGKHEWVRPDGVKLSDAHPDNFIKSTNGEIVAVDPGISAPRGWKPPTAEAESLTAEQHTQLSGAVDNAADYVDFRNDAEQDSAKAGALTKLENAARAWVAQNGSLDTANSEGKRFSARTVAHNALLDAARSGEATKTAAVEPGQAEAASGHAPGADVETQQSELQKSVRDAVAKLPEARRVIMEGILAGKGHSEIAADLGITPDKVGRLYKKATADLAKQLRGFREDYTSATADPEDAPAKPATPAPRPKGGVTPAERTAFEARNVASMQYDFANSRIVEKAIHSLNVSAQELDRRIEVNRANRERPRARGLDAISSRLEQEINRRGEEIGLDRNQLDIVRDFAKQVGEQLFDDVALSVRGSHPEASQLGNFDFANRIVSIFTGAIQRGHFERTAVHELWHALSRYVPDGEVRGVEKEFQRARARFIAKNTWAAALGKGDWGDREVSPELHAELLKTNPEVKPFLKEVRKPGLNGQDKISYKLKANEETYRLFNPDEYFAETLKDRAFRDILPSEHTAFWDRAMTWLVRISDGLKRVFGGDRLGAIFHGFLQGDYQTIQRDSAMSRLSTSKDFRMARDEHGGGRAGPELTSDALDHVVNVGKRIYRAGMDFSDWAREMVRGLGESVRPYLQKAWEGIKRVAGNINRGAIFGEGVRPGFEEAGSIGRVARRVRDIAKRAAKEQFEPEKWSDARAAALKHDAALQAVKGQVTRLSRATNEQFKTEREGNAASVWREAQGDDATLKAWEAAAHDPTLKQAAADAQTLTPEQRAFLIAAVEPTFDDVGARAEKYGLLKATTQNYVPHHTEDRQTGRTISGQGGSGRTLKSTVRYGKERTFDTFFDADQAATLPSGEARYVAKTLDIRQLLPQYVQEVQTAIAAKKFVADATKGLGGDARPLVTPRDEGSKVVETPAPAAGAYGTPAPPKKAVLTFERAPEEDTRDYKDLGDHPALKSWQWVGKDTEGNPIFRKSDLKVHPELYRFMHAALDTSRIRKWMNEPSETVLEDVGKFAARNAEIGQQYAKGTMMGFFSPFHQLTEASHAIGHQTNPVAGVLLGHLAAKVHPGLGNFFGLPNPDPSANPRAKYFAEHGLALLSTHSLEDNYAEGVGGTNRNLVTMALRKTPVLNEIGGEWVAKWADRYQEYLFGHYIPGLKLKTVENAHARNMELYAKQIADGTYSEDQIAHLSSSQINAAYGHLNYTDLKSDPTIRHIQSIVLLAPDFLKARVRFASQALFRGKAGLEQNKAIVISSTIFAATALLANQLFADKEHKKFAPSDPFAVFIGNRRYTMRNIAQDFLPIVQDLITSVKHRDIELEGTERFFNSRLSPWVGRGGLEFFTHRNWRGEKTTVGGTLKEIAAGSVLPMGARPFLTLTKTDEHRPVSPLEESLHALGVNIARSSPITETYKLASAWKDANNIEKMEGRYPVSKFQSLRYALEDGDFEGARIEYEHLVNPPALEEKSGIIARAGKMNLMREKKVADGFRKSLSQPFAGNLKDETNVKMEEQFKKSLSEDERMTYDAAVKRRATILMRFRVMQREGAAAKNVIATPE